HLALVDQALLRGVHELDRILDREDVRVLVLVDVVEHRRQGGRLARAGRPGDQDQALRLVDQFAEDRRAAQVFQRQHLGRNGAEHRACAAILVEGVDAEARQADRKSTRLNSSHVKISYAVFCLKKKKKNQTLNYI